MPPQWLDHFKENLKKVLAKFYFLKNSWQNVFAKIFAFAKKKNGFEEQNKLDQKLLTSLAKKRWPNFRQLKYLPVVLSPQERLRIKILFFITFIALIALSANLYFTHTYIVPKNGGIYTEGLVGLPKFINPLYASLNQVDQDLTKLIYSGLVRIDKQQNIVPDLAENWDISNDQRTYTFTLKPNLTWHDGEPLTVDDVVFTFQTIQNPEFKSTLSQNFDKVKVEKVDDSTVKFILDKPYTPFLENLTVGILPQHIWQEVVPANAFLADYNLKPIGSGPFKFKSLVKDKLGNIKSYTLVKNKKYYAKPPYLEKIIFKFYPDFKSACQALKNHNLDGLSYLPKELKAELSSRKDINYYSLQLPQYTALFFNQEKNEALKNLKVRYALAHAIDKQEIINQALKTEGEVIHAPILPGFIGYHPNIQKYEYNLDKAQKLLDEAGYLKKDDEPFRKKGDKELKIVLTTVNKGENYLASQVIQKMWQAVGVKTEINLVEPGIIKSEIIKNRDFEVLLFGEIVGIDPDPYPFWHSSQAGEAGLNLSNFINKDADKVLEQARQISDPKKRHDKYVHFQNILNQYLPAIFLYTPKYLYPVSSRIKGIETKNISVPADRFANITNWYIKTKRSFSR